MKFWLVWIGMAAVGALAACGSTGQSVDFDNDGASDSSDCAPADPSVYPGALEACDTTDSDCDGDLVDGFGNMDGDALPDCIDPDGDGDGFDAKDDCDDENPSTFPGAEELCDGQDNDCDEQIASDELDDLDGDGEPDCDDDDIDGDTYPNSLDCGPEDPAIFPNAAEACDDVDSDCDGDLVEGFADLDGDGLPNCIDPDADGDGFDAEDDCNDESSSTFPGAEELCDGEDNDCDDHVASDEIGDLDGDGEPDCDDDDIDGDTYPNNLDCDPEDPAVFPNADELCDGVDNDCDGDLVETFANLDGDVLPDCADPDADGDSVLAVEDCDDLDPGSTVVATDADCDGVEATEDCDDTDPLSTIVATDADCDGVEAAEDCDDLDPGSTVVATDADCDGVLPPIDCDDGNADVYPSNAEVCDSVDNNCDGLTDTQDPTVICEDLFVVLGRPASGGTNPKLVAYTTTPGDESSWQTATVGTPTDTVDWGANDTNQCLGSWAGGFYVSDASGRIWASADAETWSVVATLPGFVYSLATVGGGVWVATYAGAGGAYALSIDDMVSWTHPTTWPGGHVRAGGGQFMNTSGSHRSTNGVSWAAVTDDPAGGKAAWSEPRQEWLQILGGSSSAAYVSSDGQSWGGNVYAGGTWTIPNWGTPGSYFPIPVGTWWISAGDNPGYSGGLHYSTDGGSSWTRWDSGSWMNHGPVYNETTGEMVLMQRSSPGLPNPGNPNVYIYWSDPLNSFGVYSAKTIAGSPFKTTNGSLYPTLYVTPCSMAMFDSD